MWVARSPGVPAYVFSKKSKSPPFEPGVIPVVLGADDLGDQADLFGRTDALRRGEMGIRARSYDEQGAVDRHECARARRPEGKIARYHARRLAQRSVADTSWARSAWLGDPAGYCTAEDRQLRQLRRLYAAGHERYPIGDSSLTAPLQEQLGGAGLQKRGGTGGPGRDRTCDLAVMSRLLCR